MRQLFIVLSKIFGLLQVYYGLAYITTVIPFISQIGKMQSAADTQYTLHTISGAQHALTVGSILVMIIMIFGVAWLLIFRTVWLADKLKIPEQDDCGALSRDAILGAGVILIGVYAIIQAAPDLLMAILNSISHCKWFFASQDMLSNGAWWSGMFSVVFSTVLPPALKLLLGLVLVLKTTRIINLITKTKATTEPKD